LFAVPDDAATTVRFAISRLVVDPERFELDEQESVPEHDDFQLLENELFTLQAQRLAMVRYPTANSPW